MVLLQQLHFLGLRQSTLGIKLSQKIHELLFGTAFHLNHFSPGRNAGTNMHARFRDRQPAGHKLNERLIRFAIHGRRCDPYLQELPFPSSSARLRRIRLHLHCKRNGLRSGGHWPEHTLRQVGCVTPFEAPSPSDDLVEKAQRTYPTAPGLLAPYLYAYCLGPKIAVPTRTSVAPSAIATIKSWLIPIESSFMEIPANRWLSMRSAISRSRAK